MNIAWFFSPSTTVLDRGVGNLGVLVAPSKILILKIMFVYSWVTFSILKNLLKLNLLIIPNPTFASGFLQTCPKILVKVLWIIFKSTANFLHSQILQERKKEVVVEERALPFIQAAIIDMLQ